MAELEKKRVTSLQADLTAVKLAEEMALQGGIFTERSLKQSVASNLLNHYSFPPGNNTQVGLRFAQIKPSILFKVLRKRKSHPRPRVEQATSNDFPSFQVRCCNKCTFYFFVFLSFTKSPPSWLLWENVFANWTKLHLRCIFFFSLVLNMRLFMCPFRWINDPVKRDRDAGRLGNRPEMRLFPHPPTRYN